MNRVHGGRKLRKGGIVLNVSVGLTVLLVMLPGLSGAVGPGQVWGRIPDNPPIDDWYKTDPQSDTRGLWSTVYTFDDEDADEWTTAFTILDLNYRDFTVPDNYVYYVDYMTVPWIAITWDNLSRVIYPFVDSTGSMAYKCKYAGYGYSEDNDGVDPDASTTMNANYNLDHDGDYETDETVDFWIEIAYDLNVDPITGKGDITMHIRIVTHPNDGDTKWAHNGDKVQLIEFPFLFNPDIRGISNNDVQYKNNNNWYDVDTEAIVTTSSPGETIKVFNDNRNVLMKSNNCCQSDWYWYVLKHDSDGQFSQYPGEYINNEDTDYEDVEIWYIANYTRARLLALDAQPNWEVTADFYDLTS